MSKWEIRFIQAVLVIVGFAVAMFLHDKGIIP